MCACMRVCVHACVRACVCKREENVCRMRDEITRVSDGERERVSESGWGERGTARPGFGRIERVSERD